MGTEKKAGAEDGRAGSRTALGSAIGHVWTHMVGEVQTLERIAEAADALESWLGKNAGTNDDWPIEIKADEEGAAKLSSRLRDLNDALTPYRRDRAPSPNAQALPQPPDGHGGAERIA